MVSKVILIAAIVGLGAFFVTPMLAGPIQYSATVTATSTEISKTPEPIPEIKPPAAHLPTPTPVRAIYMSQCVVGTPSFREQLVKIAETTEVNAIVIDIKDYTGRIAFPSDNPVLKASVSTACGAADMADFIAKLHAKNIYVIGRITTFQDPYYTKLHPDQAVKKRSDGGTWKDYKGLAFIDVASQPYWDYVVALGQASYELGFDELNFDYVRYPSDGNVKDIKISAAMGHSKAEVLEKFFQYLSSKLKPTDVVISADLFGMVTTNNDDLGIGQVLERALPYFDFIDPMVYPSHFPNGFNGWSNPNQHPYDIIHFTMEKAIGRAVATTTPIFSLAYERLGTSTPAVYAKPAYPASKIRPWLQDFNYPVTYTPAMVKTQIQATYDVGLDSWLMWSPSNKYTTSVLGE